MSTIPPAPLRPFYQAADANWRDLRRILSLIIPILLGVLYTALYIHFRAQQLEIAAPHGFWGRFALRGINLLPYILLMLGILGIIVLFRTAKMLFFELYAPPEDWKLAPLILRRLLGVPPLPPPLDSVWRYPWIIIKDGELDPNHWARKVGGPAGLVVIDGTAVYLERGSRFSRVIGAGIAFLERYETIREVVDLRPQTRSRTISAWTKDGIEVKLGVRIIFRICPEESQDHHNPHLYPFDPLVVRKVVERSAVRKDKDKDELIESTGLEGVVGQLPGVVAGYISSRFLDELFFNQRKDDPFLPDQVLNDLMIPDKKRTENQTLAAEAIVIMLADLNNHLRGFGVRVTDFQITGYELDPDIKRQRLLFWESKWRGYIAKTSGEAKADQIRVREKARAEAQRDLILAIAEGLDKVDPVYLPDSLLLSLSGMLDQSLEDPLSRAFIAKDILPTLERLQELLKKH